MYFPEPWPISTAATPRLGASRLDEHRPDKDPLPELGRAPFVPGPLEVVTARLDRPEVLVYVAVPVPANTLFLPVSRSLTSGTVAS